MIDVLPDQDADLRLPSTEPPVPRRARHRPGAGPARRAAALVTRLACGPWVVIAVLALQAILCLRLVWSNTAFVDEATYLWAGHLQWAHWIHGAPVPAFATYFSGAPVLYPPLAALADSAGGLAGARLLSMAFMLGTTALLWGTTARLFGRRAALAAAVLFALLGPTQFLGGFATYDAMALFLLTVAVWCLVRARDREDSSLLVLAGIIALVAANTTKYATAVFDPSVAAVAGLVIADRRGWKAAAGRLGFVAAATIALAGGLLALGGSSYVAGVQYTTTARAAGAAPASLVLADAVRWVWVPCVIAVAGVVLSALSRRSRAATWIVGVLALSGFLVPLEQARIHTTVSLEKQVDFGAWFAAIAAGYTVAWLSGLSRRAWLRAAVAVPVVAAAAYPGWRTGPAQAMASMLGWADSSQMTAMMRPLVSQYPGRYLVEDYDVFGYYLGQKVPWQRWANTWYFHYGRQTARVTAVGTQNVTGLGAYDGAIKRGYFSLIALNFGDTAAIDSRITTDIRRYGGYHIVAELPYADRFGKGQYTVWARLPGTLPASGSTR